MPGKSEEGGCAVCGKKLLLYRCSYCGSVLCDLHRAPEKHGCPGLLEYGGHRAQGTPPGSPTSGREDGDAVPSRTGRHRRRRTLVIGLIAIAIVAVLAVALVLLLGYVIAGGPTYEHTIPVNNATGATVVLVDYRNVTDPTFANLTAFLAADDTIAHPYVYPDYTCADFARALHDKAEASGIRCGFVAIELSNASIDYAIYDNGDGKFSPPDQSAISGHALDAFDTVDRGLVYVDASSQAGYSGGREEVRIAYVVEGKELSGIDLSWANSTGYAFYESYKQAHLDLINDQRAFYARLAAYNAELNASGGFWTDALRKEHEDLSALATELNQRKNLIGPFYYPLGIVAKVNVYW